MYNTDWQEVGEHLLGAAMLLTAIAGACTAVIYLIYSIAPYYM